MTDKYENWNRSIPQEDGYFWMKDSSGGPTLYVFETINGVLMNGPASRDFRWEADGTGHLRSALFKRAAQEELNNDQ